MAQVYQIIITVTAQAGMKDILNYLIANDSIQVADKVRKGLNKVIRSLKTLPSRNGIEHDISTEQMIYRRILKWSYKIVYTIQEDPARVIIVDITHTERDPQILIDKFKK